MQASVQKAPKYILPNKLCITKYGSILYIGMDEVSQHRAHTFE